jgi:hypothetical protein
MVKPKLQWRATNKLNGSRLLSQRVALNFMQPTKGTLLKKIAP